MEGQTKKRRQHYPRQLKKKIVTEIVLGIKGVKEASSDYCMNPCNVEHWVRRFKDEILKKQTQESLTSLSMDKPEKISKEKDIGEQIQALEKENMELRKRLVETKLQAEALTTLIDLAEENYGIPLRKNSGAKQSND
jgi:transposase